MVVLSAQAATFERTIPAPNGVGDVVALTNALAEFNALGDYRTIAKIWLQPGTYDLSGVYMTSSYHLKNTTSQGGIIAGLGDGPDKTILVGGGESEAHGVWDMGGGGNWGFNTISNLTITGGWTTLNGGGICGTSSCVYRNLIVSNNYAKGSNNGAGGGGCFKGRAFDCLFADNHCTERWGGGFATGSETYCNMADNAETYGQGAWNCVFVGNSASQYGGGLAINGGGQCHGCSFTNNSVSSDGNGGCAVFVYTANYSNKYANAVFKSQILDSTFVGNHGRNGAVMVNNSSTLTAPVSNCVFRFNSCTGYTITGADMIDCLVESNTNSSTSVIFNSNMERCVVKANVLTSTTSYGIDSTDSGVVRTNVNCKIVSNSYADSGYGSILTRKVLVNCTIIDNDAVNGNWGRPVDTCWLWNSVLSGNRFGSTRRDVRINHKSGGEYSIWMTNCFFVASDFAAGEIGADGTITHDGFGNSRQISAEQLRFVDAANGDYTPHHRSPLHDAGLRDDWILSAIGATDLAGNPRLVGEGLDIGAYESQWKPKSITISFK